MLGRYLDHFDEFIGFFIASLPLLTNQRDVTEAWHARFDSVVAAMQWDVFPGMSIVLALLDDSEFGKDIKWFFSPQVNALDFKLLLVYVENCMELMLLAVQDPSSIQEMHDTPEIEAPVQERGAIRSPSYCFNFDIGDIVPKTMTELVAFIDNVKHDPPFDAIFIEDAIFRKPAICWKIIDGINGCLAHDVACMGGALQLHMNKPFSSAALSTRILAMAKIQLEILATLLSRHLDRDSP